MSKGADRPGPSAQRHAEQAIAARLARFQEHQTRLREPVIAYFRAQASIAKLRAETARKAQRVRAEADDKIAKLGKSAEEAAAGFERDARSAIEALADLGENSRGIAELLDIKQTEVRAALAEQPQGLSRPTSTHRAQPRVPGDAET